jgi:hypothetical protein
MYNLYLQSSGDVLLLFKIVMHIFNPEFFISFMCNTNYWSVYYG